MKIRYVLVAYFKNEDFPLGIQMKEKGEFKDYPSDKEIRVAIDNIYQDSFLYFKVEKRYLKTK